MTTSPVRLDPNPHAPSLARRAVADVTGATASRDLVDTAALLVSELVTNAVVHAASPVELEVDSEPGSITVRVRDADTGPLVVRGGGSELDEGGRGFLLVDRLAEAWGTEHAHGRKTVWFRVAEHPEVQRQPGSAGSAAAAMSTSRGRDEQRLARLLLPLPVAAVLTFDEHVGELLLRVMDGLGAGGARVRLTAGDTDVIARGDVAAPVVAECELMVEDRILGALTVHASPDDGSAPLTPDDAAYARLAAERLALLAAEHGILQAERTRAADQELVAEATELLTRAQNVSLTLALTTQIVVPRLAEWCAAYTVDDRGRSQRLTVNHRREERVDAVAATLDSDRETRRAVDEAARSGVAHRLPNPVPVSGQRNYLAVLPLLARDRALGLLVLGRQRPLDPVEFMAALELARRVALAVDNARLHEEQVGTVTALQKSLLPAVLPETPGVRLAARYHSASPGMLVGGDFYDAYLLPAGELAVAIGDVCGKGAEAAAVTGKTRDLLRLMLEDGAGPTSALRRLNRALAQQSPDARFCTVGVATVRRHDGGLRVRLSLAGHPEPVVLRADGSTELVGSPGDLLGVLGDDELHLEEIDVALAPGDAMVLYTDGVTERREGRRMFGQFGVRSALEAVAGADAQTIADRLDDAARSFVATDLRDDMAILVVACTPH